MHLGEVISTSNPQPEMLSLSNDLGEVIKKQILNVKEQIQGQK